MRLVLAASAALLASVSAAGATPMTLVGVNFDSANGVQEATLAAGDATPLPGRPSVGDPINGVEGFNIGSGSFAPYELRNNGTQPDDVLSLLFPNPIVNGAGSCIASANQLVGPTSAANYAGCDLLVFEVFNQSDSPTASLTLAAAMNGTQPSPPNSILGVLLGFIPNFDLDGDGDLDGGVTIWGFDLSLLNVALGGSAANPLFIGRDQGTPDIAAVVGLNFGAPPPQVPLPAALPLFFAGLAGLGFASRRRRKA